MTDTTVLVATYNLPLVALSFLIAVIASYTGLDLVGRVTLSQGRNRLMWLIGGAIAIGIGIWSTHFIAMLAYELPIPVSYDFPIVLASMVVAIIASGVAIFIVSRQQLSKLEFLAGCSFMGLGIAAMHYTGMVALRLQAVANYHQPLLALAVAVGISTSLVALCLAFRLRSDRTFIGSVKRFGSAIVMASAIAGVHYIALAAVSFTYTGKIGISSTHNINNSMLAVGIAVATLIVLALAMIASIFEQKLKIQLAKAETLHQSEERFRVLVQNASDIIVVFAADGTISYTSTSVERILGYTPADWLGKKAYELVYPQDRELAENFVKGATAHPETEITAEFRLPHTNGEARDFEVIANNLLSQPEVDGIVATYHDITIRKRNEVALRKSEERYRSLIEATAQIIWDTNPQGELFTIQPGWSAFTGQTYEEFKGWGWLNAIHPDDQNRTADAWNRTIVNRSLYQIEHRLRRYDGEYRYMSVRAVPVLEADGSIREWIGAHTDITQRQQAEEALRESNARLKFALLVGQLGDWDLDLATQTTRRSLRHDQIFGYDSLLPSWNYEIFLNHVHPEDREFVNCKFQHTLSTGEVWDFECRIIWSDQSIHWIWARASVYQNPDGKPLRILGILTDISQRKQLEQEREQLLLSEQAAREAAEAANRMKDEFLATLSHELRTPLNSMVGWTQLLRTRKFNEATIARALETIDRNTKSLAQLIEDVLDVSRIITGKFRLSSYPIELLPIVEAAIETVLPTAQTKGINIEFVKDSSVVLATPLVLGDANRLQQVLWNLLSNAIKFTPQGGRVQVRLFLAMNAQIQIIDTGIGIKPEFLPYVFERFRQADSSTTRAQGGLGLGLAIVRHIVELHGGTVYAQSQGEGKGATFTVELPLLKDKGRIIKDKERFNSSFTPHPLPLTSHSSLNGLRVLVVDDEPDARELVATALEQCNAEVKVVATAVEALEVVKEWQPDVLVSDIGMPGEDGYTLIRKLRQLDANQGGNIPALALTAYARIEDQTQALSAGFQLHMTKPVDPDELALVVGKLAGRN